jgi:hypothetical protein
MTNCGSRIDAIEALLQRACARAEAVPDRVEQEPGTVVGRAHTELAAQLLDPVDRLILEVTTLVMLPAGMSAHVLAGHRESARRLLCILDAEPSEIERVLSQDDACRLRTNLADVLADSPETGGANRTDPVL